MSELETLIPAGADVVIAGEALTIRPLKVEGLFAAVTLPRASETTAAAGSTPSST